MQTCAEILLVPGVNQTAAGRERAGCDRGWLHFKAAWRYTPVYTALRSLHSSVSFFHGILEELHAAGCVPTPQQCLPRRPPTGPRPI